MRNQKKLSQGYHACLVIGMFIWIPYLHLVVQFGFGLQKQMAPAVLGSFTSATAPSARAIEAAVSTKECVQYVADIDLMLEQQPP